MKAVFCLAGALLLGSLFLHAQNVTNPTLDGVMIYKRYPFYRDRLAQLIEYRSASFHRNVTHVFLVNGQRLILAPDADVIWIPYPGRGGYDKESAGALISETQVRYPQYRQFLENVRRAWENATPAELVRQQKASERRSTHTSDAISSLGRVIHSGFFKLKEVPSLLFSTSLNPAASPSPATAGKDASKGSSDSDSMNLEKNLKIIRDYYQSTNDKP